MVATALDDRPPLWANDLIGLCTTAETDPGAIAAELVQRVHPFDRWNLLEQIANAALKPVTGVEIDENSISSRIGAILEQLTGDPDRSLAVEATGKSADRMINLWFGEEEPTAIAAHLNAVAHNADIAQLLIRDQLHDKSPGSP